MFFIILIMLGSLLLMIPAAWNGENGLNYIDALFTATSAMCVTGLTSVSTADFSYLGQIIILLLIQIGGLGIISFTTIYIVLPRSKITFHNRKIIQEYFIFSVESKPVKIIRRIILTTLMIEVVGAFILYLEFSKSAPDRPIFTSIFHAVSAFCNAGFSLFANNLENYTHNPLINIMIPFLLVTGGLGYVVIQDVLLFLFKKKKKLALYSKVVLLTTLILVAIGACSFMFFEINNTQKGFYLIDRFMASIFQAVTPRTAGFNTVRQDFLTLPSKLLTVILMFIGGGSGSTAGGIKVGTFALVVLAIFKGTDNGGNLRLLKRKVNAKSIRHSLIFFIRAITLVFAVIFALTAAEHLFNPLNDKSLLKIVFEGFSAFATVGLSLGITSSLSIPGKLVVIFAMFFGRVGLITIAMKVYGKVSEYLVDYAEEEVLIG
ncbi:MAG: potassium transporter [Spirochaetales bacterium]|nr:potassium transporter [Spirochaetales bacterium]